MNMSLCANLPSKESQQHLHSNDMHTVVFRNKYTNGCNIFWNESKNEMDSMDGQKDRWIDAKASIVKWQNQSDRYMGI